LTAQCVAFGGVVSFSTTGLGAYQATWRHDVNNSQNPWYIEYFGYTVAGGNLPDNQIAQDLKCVSASGQPSATTVSWAIPSYTYSPDLATSPNETTIADLKAISSGSNSSVVCTYHWTGTLNGAVITDFTADDDTPETPLNGNTSPYMPDKVSAHEPSTVQKYSTTVVSQALLSPETDYQMDLIDSLNQQMPHVYVNEHFTDLTPSGFKINGDADYWTTTEPIGNFNRLDHLWWTFQSFPSPWNLMTEYDFHHIYYAGTQSANGPYNNPTAYGYACGPYKIQFIPYSPTGDTSTAQQ